MDDPAADTATPTRLSITRLHSVQQVSSCLVGHRRE
jgi:hypothetical protein